MEIKFGKGKSEYGPGVEINLSGDEIATAIDSYLVAHNIYVDGPRTITVNSDKIINGYVYVDPSGNVISEGIRYTGRGVKEE